MPRRPAFRPSPGRAPIVRRLTPRPGPRRVYALRGGIRRDEDSVLFGGARRRRLAKLIVATLLLAAGAAMAAVAASEREPPPALAEVPPRAVATAAPEPAEDDGQALLEGQEDPPVAYRDSRALGLPYANGRLVRGVLLPAEGRDFFTWDPILKRAPNREWRRWGTDALVRTLLKVAREHRAANPEAPRIGVGDLSRPHGGPFGRRYGGLGHASHQNGLDVDVYYPRWDGLERRPHEPELVDEQLAQDLVDRFVEAGATKVFVGPRLRLRGPRGVVVPLVHHDDHLHVRLPPPPG